MLVARHPVSIADRKYERGETIAPEHVEVLRAAGPRRIAHLVNAGRLEDIPDQRSPEQLAEAVRLLEERDDARQAHAEDLEARVAMLESDLDAEAAKLTPPPEEAGTGVEPSGPGPQFCDTCGDGKEYSEHGLKVHRGKSHKED